MSINLANYHKIKSIADSYQASLIAVSKTKPLSDILELNHEGQLLFGENYVQELTDKFKEAPNTIDWHFIGHLQTNKVKLIQPIAKLIHGVDSEKLLMEINKQAAKNNSISNILLQVYIAQEESKFGLDENELTTILEKYSNGNYSNIRIKGLMGMASFIDDETHVRNEFKNLVGIFNQLKARHFSQNPEFKEISMGMSGDYAIAIEQGSTMVRVGSSIFGGR
jgi:pyridoxal phosphate enzyme (YggS family)